MNLYLMRHGHAQSEAARDSLRELSAAGAIEVEKMAQTHVDELRQVDKIIASPYVRAQQTATIVAHVIGGKVIETSPLFKPGGAPTTAIEHLSDLFHNQGDQCVLVIGHQPLIGVLADELCGLEPGKYRMGTASLASLETEVMAKNCCRLRFMHHASN